MGKLMEFHVFSIIKWESWTFQNGEVDGISPSFNGPQSPRCTWAGFTSSPCLSGEAQIGQGFSKWQPPQGAGFMVMKYPLVNIQKVIENGNL